MQITINHQRDDCALLKLNGRLEGAAYLTLKRACAPWLRKAGVRQIRLDLNDVDGLGPGALGALLTLDEQAAAAGRPLRLLRGPDDVRRALEAAGLRVFGRVA
jgi:anti-anti-sigma factor